MNANTKSCQRVVLFSTPSTLSKMDDPTEVEYLTELTICPGRVSRKFLEQMILDFESKSPNLKIDYVPKETWTHAWFLPLPEDGEISDKAISIERSLN